MCNVPYHHTFIRMTQGNIGRSEIAMTDEPPSYSHSPSTWPHKITHPTLTAWQRNMSLRPDLPIQLPPFSHNACPRSLVAQQPFQVYTGFCVKFPHRAVTSPLFATLVPKITVVTTALAPPHRLLYSAWAWNCPRLSEFFLPYHNRCGFWAKHLWFLMYPAYFWLCKPNSSCSHLRFPAWTHHFFPLKPTFWLDVQNSTINGKTGICVGFNFHLFTMKSSFIVVKLNFFVCPVHDRNPSTTKGNKHVAFTTIEGPI